MLLRKGAMLLKDCRAFIRPSLDKGVKKHWGPVCLMYPNFVADRLVFFPTCGWSLPSKVEGLRVALKVIRGE